MSKSLAQIRKKNGLDEDIHFVIFQLFIPTWMDTCPLTVLCHLFVS